MTMTSIRETYDLPRRAPVPIRHWAVMLGVPVLAIVLWLLLPHTPIVVGILVVAVLAAVFIGVAGVLSSRQLREEPGRRPTTPPSTEPRG